MTTLPVVANTLRVQRNGRDALTLWIDGVEYRLMGNHDDPRVRTFFAGLHMANSIALTVDENPRHPVRE